MPRSLAKDDLGEFSNITVAGRDVLAVEVGSADHVLYVLVADAKWDADEHEWLLIEKHEYDELDAAGLTYTALISHLYALVIEAASKERAKYSHLSTAEWTDKYDKVFARLAVERRRRIDSISSESSLNGRMAIAAGVMYGLSDKFIKENSMKEFFLFYGDINYDLYYPTFKKDIVVEAFAHKEEWSSYFPYLQAGITDMSLIEHAVENDIDVSLLTVVA